MVPGEQFPLRALRRPLAAFALTATLVWWLANGDGSFYLVGIDGPVSSLIGPALTALSAGATVAIVLALLHAAVGITPAVAATLATVMLPSFMHVHRGSLVGPPLLALMLFMLAVMVHAPRFSFAYGALAAFLAVFVSPQAVGLPIAAAIWAGVQAARRGRRVGRRALLALAPLLVAIVIGLATGSDAWSGPMQLGWRGGFDAAVGAAGHVIGNQVAPGAHAGVMRWLIIADAALIIIGVIGMSWRRDIRVAPAGNTARRMFEATLLTGVLYALGMTARTMVDTRAANPSDAEVLPVVVFILLLLAMSTAMRWTRWTRLGKFVALLLGITWGSAALLFR